MSGGSRSLPARPSLRYLKLEAKRRLAAGEFPALHAAQTAIAREHGQPGWAALRLLISSQPGQDSHALAQLRWIAERFSGAGEPGWSAPGEQEMREHFDDHFLAGIPASELTAAFAAAAPDLRQELAVIGQQPLQARVQIAGTQYFASVEADPPHRLTGLRGQSTRITDPRLAGPPPTRTLGDVPDAVAESAKELYAEQGLVGLVMAGRLDGQPWVLTKGWADLERAEPLAADHGFPALGIAALVTVTAVLRLIADGCFSLDAPVNNHLSTMRVADDAVTIRELLSHTGGVGNPAPDQMFAASIPDLAALAGPVISWSGERGVIRPSNGGYAVLGQLIADVTGMPYTDAVTRLVLMPLGLSSSSMPARASGIGPRAVTGYTVSRDGIAQPLPATVCTIPAVGGLLATAADLVSLGTDWPSLLPHALASEALTPQTAPGAGGVRIGLGWLLPERGDVAVHAGTGPGASASLVRRLSDGAVHVTMTNRSASIGFIDDGLLGSPARSD